MATIWQTVNSALTSLNKPMAQNLYLPVTGAELPDEYIVYTLITNYGTEHANDVEKCREHHVQVSYYNRAGLAGMPGIAAAMTGAGFTRGPERELPYNEYTRHFGLALEFYYYEG